MDGHPPRPPRRKTPVACQFCRLKKNKCDGLRPVCGACSRKGWGIDKCIYRHIERKNETVSESVIRRLQDRIESLEQSRQQLPPPRPAHQTSPPQQIQEIIDVDNSPLSITETPATGIEVNAITCAATGESQSEGFHGSSSAASFLNTVRQAIEGQGSVNFTTGTSPAARRLAPSINQRLVYVLPPHKMSDELQEGYWKFVYPLYPFVDRGTFHQIYGCLWAGTSLPRGSSRVMRLEEADSVASLNLVLALGCQYRAQTEPGEAHDEAEVFFNRAHALVGFDPTEPSLLTLQSLQVMLLMAQYLTGTGNTHKAWGIIGMALRGCHHLGLHRDTVYDKNVLDTQDKKRVRMVYHGCLMLERMICMNLGRPAMGTTNEKEPISLPSETDYEDSSIADIATSAPGSVLTFFVASTKLYQIAHKILISFYSDENFEQVRGYEQHFEGETSVFRFERELQAWCDEIPAYLQFQSETGPGMARTDSQMIFRRQAVVLRLRYLQVRIYLFRPIFARFCVSQPAADVSLGRTQRPCGDDLNYRVALQSCILCVKAARELIEIMHDNLITARSWGRKPAWLYGVLHVYLSATVLLAARLKPVVTLGAISDAELHISWQRAMQILRCFQNDSTSAKRCVTALSTLYEKLSLPTDARFSGEAESTTAELHPPSMVSIDQELLQNSGPLNEALIDPAALNSQEMAEVFGWLDSFENFDPSDLSWLNVVPGNLLA